MTVPFRPPPLAGFYAGCGTGLPGTDEGTDHTAALIRAREEGFAEGRALGREEGHASGLSEGEAQTRDAIKPELNALHELNAKHGRYDAVAQALRLVLEARATDRAALESDVRGVIAAMLRRLFPLLLSRAAGGEIAALLGEALTERAPERLTLRAHPETLASVAA